MAGRNSEGPADPFVPPGSDTEATLDLRERPTRPIAAQTTAPEEPLFIPEGRKPVAYRKPGAGPLAWVITFGGLAAATFLGWTYLQKRPEKAVAGSRPAVTAPAAAPAKPVVWKKVETGDAVLVTVELTPKAPDARILLDGEPVSSNPVRVPKGGQHTLQAHADGYEPARAEITADGPQTVRLRLKKSR